MALLQYDFAVVGVNNVNRAFASIERRAAQHNARVARTFGGSTSGARTSLQKGNASAQAKQAERAFIQSERRKHREVEKSLQQRQRLEARGLRQQQRREELAARKRERIRDKELREIKRNQQRRQLLAERSAKAEQRAAATALRERQRAVGGTMGRVGRSAGGALRSVGSMALGAGSIIGGFAVGNAVSQQMKETRMASQLANQAGTPEAKGAILRESQQVRGFSGEEVLQGMTGFVDLTGDLTTARKIMKDMADLSLATGSSLEDVASASGNFANNLKGIKDPAEKARKVMEAMRALAGQGLAGAIELKDLAGGGAAVGAVASQMGGDVTTNIKKAGVLAQAARAEGGAESAAEALTAIGRFTDMLATKAGKLEKMGVSVGQRDSTGALTEIGDPRKIIADVLQATGGDIGEITKLFGVRGQKVVRGFLRSFKEQGRQGVYSRFDELMQTELSTGQIASNKASRLADPDLQFKDAMKEFNSVVGAEMLPALTKLLPALAELAPHVATAARLMAKFVETLAENPLSTIGALLAAKVVADIAAAQIGEAAKGALVGAISGRGSPSPSGSTGGPTGGRMGAAMNGLAFGAVAAMTIYANGVVNFHSREAQMDRAGERLQLLRNMGGQDLDAAKELLKQQKKETDATKQPGFFESFMGSELIAGLTPTFMRQDHDPIKSGRMLGRDTDELFGNRDETQVRTNEAFEAQAQQELQRIQREAAEAQKTAADKLGQAADKWSLLGPNRGDSPTSPGT